MGVKKESREQLNGLKKPTTYNSGQAYEHISYLKDIAREIKSSDSSKRCKRSKISRAIKKHRRPRLSKGRNGDADNNRRDKRIGKGDWYTES